jgi:hypothetical protein
MKASAQRTGTFCTTLNVQQRQSPTFRKVGTESPGSLLPFDATDDVDKYQDCRAAIVQIREVTMRTYTILIALLAVVSTPAFAVNLFVPSQYATIQDAVYAANQGDRIIVSAGSYDGAFINKRVTVQGEGDQTVITNGPSAGFFPFFFQNGFQISTGGDGTTISNLKIELSPAVPPAGFELVQVGMFSNFVDKVKVSNVRFVGLNRGIDARNSEKWQVTNNTIEGLNASQSRQAIGILLLQNSKSFVGFNTINHSSADNAGKEYYGIALLAGSNSMENNKVVQNQVSVDAAGAYKSADIWLADFSAQAGGPVLISNNKLIENDVETILLEPPVLVDHNVIEPSD